MARGGVESVLIIKFFVCTGRGILHFTNVVSSILIIVTDILLL